MFHHPEEVSAHDEADILLGEMPEQKVTGEVDYLGSICQTWHTAVAVKVRTESYVFLTHYLCCMTEMFDGINDGGFAFLAQETMIDRCLRYTIMLCQSPHLVVGEVARMVTQGASRAMATNDGNFTQFQSIVEA